MLRTLFVLGLFGFGAVHALRGPFYALLLYLWIAYFRPQEWVWGGIVQQLNLSLYAGVYVVIAAVVTGQALRVNWRSSLLFVILLQSLASTLASPYSEYAWVFWVDFLKSTMIAALLAALVTDVARLRLVFVVMALSLGFEATKQGWAQFFLNPGAENTNSINFLGDNNGVAIGMFMLVPMIVTLAQTAHPRVWRWPWIVALGGVAYRGISTFSRGGFLTILTVAALYILRSRRRLAAIFAICVLSLIILPVLGDAFWNRVRSITVVSEAQMTDENARDVASTLGRLHFWQVAMRMAEARPFLGVGHNAFVPAYDNYDFSDGAYGRGRSVHSSWFGVLAELGVPGLFVYVLTFWLSIRACRRARRQARQDARLADLVPYAVALETALIAAAVGSTFVIFQYTEMLWHFIGLTIALERIAAGRVAQRPAAQEASIGHAAVQFPRRVAVS